MERKDDYLRQFGNRLAALRKQKNLSVRELAAAANLGYRQVLQIEAGLVNPRFTTILALARALEVRPDELLK